MGDDAECGLCDEPACDEGHLIDVRNEETEEIKRVSLCREHYDKMLAHNRGEEVDWDG